MCEGVNSWSFRSVAILGAEGSPADWRLFSILARRNSQGHYVERHVIQSLLGMKLNLVGDTTGLPLATTGSGLYVLKHRLDSFNRIWWVPSGVPWRRLRAPSRPCWTPL